MAIDEWVLRSARTQNRVWQQEGLPLLQVSVNWSTCQLKQENLIETIERILLETNFTIGISQRVRLS
ncbi:hypothetical protein IQ238_09455 [Pleurocapsales cyanobacterium LEGE 06147]|nr:hypothetical protein [Pleurocapsales cyanobacterium LEGE 06147]